MRRAFLAAFILVGVGALISAAPTPAPTKPLPQKLTQRVNFEGIDDPKSTLSETLDKLAKRYDMTFDINEAAFKFENVADVAKTEIAGTPIPAMKNARLSTILSKILSRIPVPSGATYLLRGDHIEITTGIFREAMVWGNYNGPKLPLVHTTLEKIPLEDAVKELAEQAEFNVVLDNRAGDKAKTPVTARFLNTPLDTAVRLLADMADLRSVHLDNVLYVTTKENAAALQSRLDKELGIGQGEEGLPPNQRKGRGPGLITIAPGNGGA